MKFMYSDVYRNRRIIFPSHPLSLTHTHIFSFILQSGIEELITDYSPYSLTIVVSISASLFYLYKLVELNKADRFDAPFIIHNV
jgi:hypothetical protein